MNRFIRNVLFYLVVAVVAMWMFDYYAVNKTTMVQKKNEINYTAFVQEVDAGRVASVVILDNSITGKTSDGQEFVVLVPPYDRNIIQRLEDNKVDITIDKEPQSPWWLNILTSILPMLLIVGLWFFMMNGEGPGGNRNPFNFGKAKVRKAPGKVEKVTFGDVAGADEAKQELQEVVEFLKDSKKYNEVGAKIPKGVLLYGPPGTGKTLLAKAVAGEAGVPFFSISGSDFVEMFVGVGASRVRSLFGMAKKNAPCIIFIDEIDAVGRQRGTGLGGGHDEREQTLNQLLVEMDGFAGNSGIIMIAATNRPDVLDPALLRPGRFDRQIVVDRPDIKGREAILKVHTKGKPVGEDVKLDIIAARTPGFTGADLSNLVNEAALMTARKSKKIINMPEMEEAAERVIMGPERKSRVISDKEKLLTAYHEGGHTVLGMLLPHTDPVHKVTIIPRGRAGGYTLSLPTEDKYYATKSEMLDELKVLLAGRVAEELVLKEISSGASNDLQRATQLAHQMVCTYGMSDKLGPVTYGRGESQVFLGRDYTRDKEYSEKVAAEIDQEVRHIMNEAYDETKKLLSENIHKLHSLAAGLLEHETLERDQIEGYMEYATVVKLIKETSAAAKDNGEVETDETEETVSGTDQLAPEDQVSGEESLP